MSNSSGPVLLDPPSPAWTTDILARSGKFYLRSRGLSKRIVAKLFRIELAVWYAVFVRLIPVSRVAEALHMSVANVRWTAYNAEQILKAHGIKSRGIR